MAGMISWIGVVVFDLPPKMLLNTSNAVFFSPPQTLLNHPDVVLLTPPQTCVGLLLNEGGIFVDYFRFEMMLECINPFIT